MEDKTIMTEEITVVDMETVENEVKVDDVAYIESSTYRVFSNGTKELACTARYPKPSDKPIDLEPKQLDRIEAAVSKSHQDIIDEYTLELLEGGII